MPVGNAKCQKESNHDHGPMECLGVSIHMANRLKQETDYIHCVPQRSEHLIP